MKDYGTVAGLIAIVMCLIELIKFIINKVFHDKESTGMTQKEHEMLKQLFDVHNRHDSN